MWDVSKTLRSRWFGLHPHQSPPLPPTAPFSSSTPPFPLPLHPQLLRQHPPPLPSPPPPPTSPPPTNIPRQTHPASIPSPHRPPAYLPHRPPESASASRIPPASTSRVYRVRIGLPHFKQGSCCIPSPLRPQGIEFGVYFPRLPHDVRPQATHPRDEDLGR